MTIRSRRRGQARARPPRAVRYKSGMTETGQRRWQLGAVVVLAAVVVAIAVAVSSGGSAPALVPGHPVPHAAEIGALLAGVPERGVALGAPDAPVTLIEFADLQCPTCAAFANGTLPTLIRREVRPGRLRIVFAPLTFVGSDSRRGAEAALAAGEQNRLWPFVELFFANQREENSGYVTDRFLTALAQGAGQVNMARALAARAAPAITGSLASTAALAARLQISSTPSFALSRTGAAPVSFIPADLQASAFTAAIGRLASPDVR